MPSDKAKIQGIKKNIDSFRADSTFTKLKKRWEDDFDLFRLLPYNAGSGYYSYTSNSPRVLAEKLNPARVTRAHRVRMVAMDVDGAAERSVDHGHHYREAQRRSDVHYLPHQRQPVRACRSYRARAGRRGTHRGVHRAVL